MGGRGQRSDGPVSCPSCLCADPPSLCFCYKGNSLSRVHLGELPVSASCFPAFGPASPGVIYAAVLLGTWGKPLLGTGQEPGPEPACVVSSPCFVGCGTLGKVLGGPQFPPLTPPTLLGCGESETSKCLAHFPGLLSAPPWWPSQASDTLFVPLPVISTGV